MPPRDEALDSKSVDAWLKPRVPGLAGEPEVTQYASGASNWTYRLRYPTHDLVLRRPPAGTKSRGSHDMAREHRVQSALRPAFARVPEMVALCEDEVVLGVPFYVMRHVDGVVPRRRALGVDVTPEQARRLCENAVDTLAALHAVDVEKVGLADLGKGPGYPTRQIEGWASRYQKARTWNVPSFARVISWLRARTPKDSAFCVIHNDYRLDNLVLDPKDPMRIVAVLDWEMATIGDPLMDLGNSLAYWVQADDDRFARATQRQPTTLPGMMTRAEVVERYAARTGRAIDDWTFYEVYGHFRLAVIVQQIYYRYHHKETRNRTFRNFWLLVHYLERRCRRAIREAGR